MVKKSVVLFYKNAKKKKAERRKCEDKREQHGSIIACAKLKTKIGGLNNIYFFTCKYLSAKSPCINNTIVNDL